MFLVKEGAVLTPPLDAGILAGITRDVLFRIFPELGLSLREEPIAIEALRAADEAFVTSSTREAMPIRSVDGRPVGDGRPGPVTRKIIAAFRAYAEAGRG